MDYLDAHPLDLTVLLPSLKKDSALKRLIMLCSWSGWFRQLHICVRVICPDCSLDPWSLNRLQELSIELIRDPELMRHHLGSLATSIEKPVFGKVSRMVQTTMILSYQNKAILVCRQIHAKSLQKIVEKALDVQYQWLKTDCARFCDQRFASLSR